MRIIHTADLHLGQIMYQDYSRDDEHDHFFAQLESWCLDYRPDALVVSGDIFDIQQPGASVKRRFNEYFVHLHNLLPDMAIVITAGNHDSASRIHADNAVWSLGNVKLVGIPPASDSLSHPDGWQLDYIVHLPQGFIVAMPFTLGSRQDIVQSILDYVSQLNSGQKPVVLMGHLAVTGTDFTGHNVDIGHLQTVNPDDLGSGFDYMALGHIHRPQTLGYPGEHEPSSIYPAGVIRYSGSPLHVSCDEKYPHTVSLVDIDCHGGNVTLTRLRIDEKLHFYELPLNGPASSADEALASLRQFALDHPSFYFRFVLDGSVILPPDFNQQVYQFIESSQQDIRYNPKPLWVNLPQNEETGSQPLFQVADLQQMTNPMDFIRQTQSHYPEFDIEELAEAFKEVEAEVRRLNDDPQSPDNEN